MSSFLKEEIGVAMSGVKWDTGNFKLWQSTNPNIILFSPKQPVLAKGPDGRHQFGVSQFRQQTDDTYKITGGNAIFTITSAIQLEDGELERLKQQWLTEGRGRYGDSIPPNPRFIPLNVRKGEAQVLINPISGTPNRAHNEASKGTPGGTMSFLVELTEAGAQEWVQGIKQNSVIPAGVKFDYEYLRMLPSIGAEVKIHSRRVFTHLSTDLNISVGGRLFGGSVQIDAAWEKMVGKGDVEIKFIGTGQSPEIEELRSELVNTFAEQAKQQLFDTLFEPAPDIEEAQAGNRRGRFGGANFALKWKKITDARDLHLKIEFEGWTWLRGNMDTNLAALVAGLDETYINEVNTQLTSPASIVIDSDPLLEGVTMSWSASEGKGPEAPIFQENGGNVQYLVTSQNINDVKVDWNATINFSPSSWPLIQTSGGAPMASGGNQISLKPASWVNRHWVYMFVREQDLILPPNEDDYLICNVSFEGPHLTRPIKAASRLSPLTPLEFSYPLSPDGKGGKAKFSAFGLIGGKLVRSDEQEINLDEEAVFILASKDKVELVSQNSAFPESLSENSLEHRLLKASGRPLISVIQPGDDIRSQGPESDVGGASGSHNNVIEGYVVGFGVETNTEPATIFIKKENGKAEEVKLHSESADHFRDGRRRKVRIVLNNSGYAMDITEIFT